MRALFAVLLFAFACSDKSGSDDPAGSGDGTDGTDGTDDSGDGGDDGGDGADEDAEWGYSGDIGPEHWGELDDDYAACSEGTAQSPINIESADMVILTDTPPVVSWGNTALRAFNPGHYIRYEVDSGSTMTWDGYTYNLKQFHFHGLSEHTLGGQHAAVEIHFVHARQDDDKKLAVIAMVADPDEAAGLVGVFDEGGALLFPDALALEESEVVTDLGATVDLGALFPFTDAYGFIHYTGSLTTPPCTEGVEFFIVATMLPMLPADVDAFHAVYDFNYRPVQDLNGREVSYLSVGVE